MARRVPKHVRVRNIFRAIPRPLFMWVSIPLAVYAVVSENVSEGKLAWLLGLIAGLFGVREIGKIYRGSNDSSEPSFYSSRKFDNPGQSRENEMDEAFERFNRDYPDDDAPMRPPDI